MRKIFLFFLSVIFYISTFSQTVDLIGKASSEVLLKAKGNFIGKEYLDENDSSYYALTYVDPDPTLPSQTYFYIKHDTCINVSILFLAENLSAVITAFNKIYVKVGDSDWLYYSENGILSVHLDIVVGGAGIFRYTKK